MNARGARALQKYFERLVANGKPLIANKILIIAYVLTHMMSKSIHWISKKCAKYIDHMKNILITFFTFPWIMNEGTCKWWSYEVLSPFRHLAVYFFVMKLMLPKSHLKYQTHHHSTMLYQQCSPGPPWQNATSKFPDVIFSLKNQHLWPFW